MVAIVYQLYSSAVFPVSCSDKFLKAEELKVHLKILDEVRLHWIIAVAVDYFTVKMFSIMA